MDRASRVRIGVGVAIAACVLTGCSGGPGVARTVTPGAPEDVVLDPMDTKPVATWIDRDETFAIITWGSGSCPPVATALTAEEPDRVAVTFGRSPQAACTADMSPTTHEFELPDGITGDPVTVVVEYEDWAEIHTLILE